ncbi:DsbA family protein [Terricaulis silvestris]|uniref:Protein-disulfide isomerase n=1 Tax=Terricaulis silvestris TaxID=2686094 RepID=A0A6I6MRJ1_9CAUL|nr:DsbA family protein [Terricaulis silvestris]QGZ95417.1 Protein-disulfide isomerase [Terricaulis silvestris]
MARFLAGLAALFALILTPASAQSFNAQEQAEMRAIVREYLVNNPDVLREALDALAERTESERWQRLKSDNRDFSLGPADAPIVIVEFFDYRCGFCHAALEWVTDVSRTRRDVRVVFKEFPILSEESMEASRAAIAAMPQGRYWAFHQALMGFRGDLTSARIDQLARDSGIDVARMRRGMESEAITQLIMDNRAHAIEMDNTATPIFIINGEMVAGFNRPLLETRLREATREARARRQASR